MRGGLARFLGLVTLGGLSATYVQSGLAKALISWLWSFLSWLVSLPVAWDVIQLFCGLSFFGWLAFIRLNDEEIRRVPKEKQEKARENLRLLGNYFFVAFVLYIACAFADYLIHNRTLVSIFLDAEQVMPMLILAVVMTGLFGLVMLVAPMAIARGIGQHGRGLGDINPPPIGLVFATFIPAPFNIVMALFLLPHLYTLAIGGQLILVFVAASCLGTWVMWKYWSSLRWIFLLAILEPLGPLLCCVVLLLHMTLYYTPALISTIIETRTIIGGNFTTTTTTTVSTVTSLLAPSMNMGSPTFTILPFLLVFLYPLTSYLLRTLFLSCELP